MYGTNICFLYEQIRTHAITSTYYVSPKLGIEVVFEEALLRTRGFYSDSDSKYRVSRSKNRLGLGLVKHGRMNKTLSRSVSNKLPTCKVSD